MLMVQIVFIGPHSFVVIYKPLRCQDTGSTSGRFNLIFRDVEMRRLTSINVSIVLLSAKISTGKIAMVHAQPIPEVDWVLFGGLSCWGLKLTSRLNL
jgi:hypothetical protein